MISNPYILTKHTFYDVFTPEECESIIKNSEILLTEQGKVDEGSLINNVRKTKVSYLMLGEKNRWIAGKVIPRIQYINDKYYKFHISGVNEMHLLEYTEGCFYGWHLDLAPTRKLTFIVFLTDPKNYDGGELAWDFFVDETPPNPKQGTVILFPSFLPHRVKEVKRGIRHSLVGWVHGNSFV